MLISSKKRMAVDTYREPTLNYAHLWVYHEVRLLVSSGTRADLCFQNPRGMCTNLDMHSIAQADLREEDLVRQKPVLHPLSEIEGNPFEHFDDVFWDAGGRVGGW